MPNELLYLLVFLLLITLVVFRDEVIIALISIVLFLIGLGWLGLILGVLFTVVIGITVYSVTKRLFK